MALPIYTFPVILLNHIYITAWFFKSLNIFNFEVLRSSYTLTGVLGKTGVLIMDLSEFLVLSFFGLL